MLGCDCAAYQTTRSKLLKGTQRDRSLTFARAILCATIVITAAGINLSAYAEAENEGSNAAGTESGLTTDVLFGGPTSPEGLIEQAARVKEPAFRFDGIYDAFEPWRDWKSGVKKDHGFSFSGHYALAVQGANDALAGGSTSGSSGVLRLTGIWELLNRGKSNSGSLAMTLDHRHAFNEPAPADMAEEIGYIGLTNTFFSDDGFMVINLNWQQRLNNGDSGFIIGRYDPNDYMNILGYVNPWSMFTNLAILLDVSVAIPDSSWGVGAGHWFNDQWYVLGGVNDANGSGTDDLELFKGGSELFKYAHIGWSPSKSRRYYANVHLLVWDVDEREDANVSAANGFALAANWTFNDTWMPFARYGQSDGTAPIYNKAATLGFIRKFHYRSDVAGLAVNRGELPPNPAWVSRTQTTVEAFWQIQFARNLEIIPNVQYLKNPGLNTASDDVWSVGVRALLSF
jgi:porin